MSGTLGRLAIRIEADHTGLEAGLRRSEALVSQSRAKIGRLMKVGFAVGLGVNTFNTALVASRQLLNGLTAGVISFNAKIDQSTAVWARWLGSTEKAQQAVAKYFEIAKATPFNFADVLKGATVMQAMGGSVLNTVENLRLFGDAAAATVDVTGSLSQGFKQVTFWSARLYNDLQKGAATGRSLMRLSQIGVMSPETRAQIELAQKMGVQADDIFKIYTSNLDRFSGLMDDQQKNLYTQLSTFQDNLTQIGATVGRPIFDTFIEGIVAVNKALTSTDFRAFQQKAAAFLDQQVKSWKATFTDPENIARFLAVGRSALSLFEKLVAAATMFYNAIKPIVLAFGGLIAVLDKFTKGNAAFFALLTIGFVRFRRELAFIRDLALFREGFTSAPRDKDGRVLTSTERRLYNERMQADADAAVSKADEHVVASRERQERSSRSLDLATAREATARNRLATLNALVTARSAALTNAKNALPGAQATLAQSQAEIAALGGSEALNASIAEYKRLEEERAALQRTHIGLLKAETSAQEKLTAAQERAAVMTARVDKLNARQAQTMAELNAISRAGSTIKGRTTSANRVLEPLGGAETVRANLAELRRTEAAQATIIADRVGLQQKVADAARKANIDAQALAIKEQNLRKASGTPRQAAADLAVQRASATSLRSQASLAEKSDALARNMRLENDARERAALLTKQLGDNTELAARKLQLYDAAQLDATENDRKRATVLKEQERQSNTLVRAMDKQATALAKETEAKRASNTAMFDVAENRTLLDANATRMAAVSASVGGIDDAVAKSAAYTTAVSEVNRLNKQIESGEKSVATAQQQRSSAMNALVGKINSRITAEQTLATRVKITEEAEKQAAVAVRDRATVMDRAGGAFNKFVGALAAISILYFGLDAATNALMGQGLLDLTKSLITYGDTLGKTREEVKQFAAANAGSTDAFVKAVDATKAKLAELKAEQQERKDAAAKMQAVPWTIEARWKNETLVRGILNWFQQGRGADEIAQATKKLELLTAQLQRLQELSNMGLPELEAVLKADEAKPVSVETNQEIADIKAIIKQRKLLAEEKEKQRRQDLADAGLGGFLPKQLADLRAQATEYNNAGKGAFEQYVKGWNSANRDTFKNLHDFMKGAISQDAGGQFNLPEQLKLQQVDNLLAAAINQMRDFGSISQETMTKLEAAAGSSAGQLAQLVSVLADVQKNTALAGAQGVITNVMQGIVNSKVNASKADLGERQKYINDARLTQEEQLKPLDYQIKGINDQITQIGDAAARTARAWQEKIRPAERYLEQFQREAKARADASAREIDTFSRGAADRAKAAQAAIDTFSKESKARADAMKVQVDAAQKAASTAQTLATQRQGAYNAVLNGTTEQFLKQLEIQDDLTKAITEKWEAEIGGARRMKDATAERSDRLSANQRKALLAFDEELARARDRGDTSAVQRITAQRALYEKRGAADISLAQSRAAVAADDYNARTKALTKEQQQQQDVDNQRVKAANDALSAVQAQAQAQSEADQAALQAMQDRAKEQADADQAALQALQDRAKAQADADQAQADAVAEEIRIWQQQAQDEADKYQADQVALQDRLKVLQGERDKVKSFWDDVIAQGQKEYDQAKDRWDGEIEAANKNLQTSKDLQAAYTDLANKGKEWVNSILEQNKLLDTQYNSWVAIYNVIAKLLNLPQLDFTRPRPENTPAPPGYKWIVDDAGGWSLVLNPDATPPPPPQPPPAPDPPTPGGGRGELTASSIPEPTAYGRRSLGMIYNQNAPLADTFVIREDADVGKVATAIVELQRTAMAGVISSGSALV